MIAPIEKFREPMASHRPYEVEPLEGPSDQRPLRDVGTRTSDRVSEIIGRYPVVAISASVAVGLTLGWLIKRKWNG